MPEVWLEVLETVSANPGSVLSHYVQTDSLFEYKEEIQSLQEMNRSQAKLCVSHQA